jgi:large subunit ribosomal protein L1
MYFPIEDVIRNIRAFVTSVKRATGNLDEDESRKKDNTKPGTSVYNTKICPYVNRTAVVTISRIILSSVQGPGIELRDT